MKSFKPLWAILILVALGALFMLSPYSQKTIMAADSDESPAEVVAMADEQPAHDAASMATENAVSQSHVAVQADDVEEETATSDLTSEEHVLSARTLGDPNAPVKLEEFASLSCPHCAHFHTDVFPQIKEAYIDTGKVFFTFTDFPLNAPALEGTLISRCLPKARYFKFLSFLFEKQPDWAFADGYTQYLKQNSRLLGLSEQDAEACLTNETLRVGLIGKVQAAQEKYEINSTPSFVLNGTDVINGGQSFEEFQKKIDALLK